MLQLVGFFDDTENGLLKQHCDRHGWSLTFGECVFCFPKYQVHYFQENGFASAKELRANGVETQHESDQQPQANRVRPIHCGDR